MENTAERKEGDGIDPATPGTEQAGFDDFRDARSFELVDAHEDLSSERIKKQETRYIEHQRNSFLANELSVTLGSTLNESVQEDDAYVKQLEAQDRIRMAKEYALYKHQHNWGVFHNYADGGQADNLSREEWDTEVFSQTLKEPTCSKLHRGCSIISHLAMFAFCLYATITITDDTLVIGGKSKNDSDFNFGVCPERCRPHHATCPRKFFNEFDNIVWRQSTRVDKNCADTCKRHAMKCKPYYPKSDTGLPRNECVQTCPPFSIYYNYA